MNGFVVFQGVSKNDLEKRVQLEKYKKSMLKNFNMFVSPGKKPFIN